LIRTAEFRLKADKQCSQRMPGLDELLAEAKKRKVKFAAISNLGYEYEGHLDEFVSDIDTRMLSYQVGAMKPDREMFLTAARELGVAPEEMAHIGNSEDNDVEGALSAGFAASLWYPKRQKYFSAEELQSANTLMSLDRAFDKMREMKFRF
jgi:HAD superfamily hydrolase (TIGR01509 family)